MKVRCGGLGLGVEIKTVVRHQLVSERDREGERVITLTQNRQREERRGKVRVAARCPVGHLLSLCPVNMAS